MTGYIDAILHIADLPALIASIAAVDPSLVSEDGVVNGFNRTPMTMLGKTALAYVRMTPDEAARWRGTPLVTILAEAPYGPNAADVIYDAIWSDPAALALYDAVYPRAAVTWADDEGQSHIFTPPFRFGVIG